MSNPDDSTRTPTTGTLPAEWETTAEWRTRATWQVPAVPAWDEQQIREAIFHAEHAVALLRTKSARPADARRELERAIAALRQMTQRPTTDGREDQS